MSMELPSHHEELTSQSEQLPSHHEELTSQSEQPPSHHEELTSQHENPPVEQPLPSLEEIEREIKEKNERLTALHSGYSTILESVVSKYEEDLSFLAHKQVVIRDHMEFVSKQIDWLSKKADEQDRYERLDEFDEERAMAPTAIEALIEVREELNRAYEAFDEKCTPEALKMIGNREGLSDAQIDTLKLVCHIREEEEDDYEHAKVLLTSNYFVEFFRRRSEFLIKMRDSLKPEIMKEIDEYCMNPKHNVDALYRCGEPIGVFGQWIRAIRNYYRLQYYTAPLFLRDKSEKHVKLIKNSLEDITRGHFIRCIEARTPKAPPRIEDTPAAETISQRASETHSKIWTSQELRAQGNGESLQDINARGQDAAVPDGPMETHSKIWSLDEIRSLNEVPVPPDGSDAYANTEEPRHDTLSDLRGEQDVQSLAELRSQAEARAMAARASDAGERKPSMLSGVSGRVSQTELASANRPPSVPQPRKPSTASGVSGRASQPELASANKLPPVLPERNPSTASGASGRASQPELESNPRKSPCPPSQPPTSQRPSLAVPPSEHESQLVVSEEAPVEVLPYHSEASAETLQEIQKLYDLLADLENRLVEAQRELEEMEQKICDEMRDVRLQYDNDMVAVEEALENQVKDYVKVLMESRKMKKAEVEELVSVHSHVSEAVKVGESSNKSI